MLLARFAPVDSKRYNSLSEKAKGLDKVVEWFSPQLFAIWTIFVIGMSVGKAQSDRFYFWDWSSWLIGIIGIIIISVILNILLKRIKIDASDISLNSQRYNIVIAIVLLFGGYVLTAGINSISSLLLYMFPYAAILIIHTILSNSDSNLIPKESNKHIKSVFSILLIFSTSLITPSGIGISPYLLASSK